MRKKKRNRINLLILILLIILVVLTYLFARNLKKVESKEEKEKLIEKNTKDEWVDLNLRYLGSAKTMLEEWGINEEGDFNKLEDGGVIYHIGSYKIFSSPEEYIKYDKQMNKIYDEDFIFKEKEGKRYVYMYGRKMNWLQYNPGRKSMSGGYANRAGLDWDMEFTKNTLFFYEYDFKDYGYLVDMTMEVFVDEKNGKVYWADEEKKVYLE